MFAVLPASFSCGCGDGGSLLLHQHQHHHYRRRHLPSLRLALTGPCAGDRGLLQDPLHHHHLQQQRCQHHFHLHSATLLSSSPICTCAENDGLERHSFLSLGCVGNGGQAHFRLQAHPQQHLSLQQQQQRHLQQQHKQQILKQRQEAILKSIVEHQTRLQHSALLSATSEIEPTANGYAPPGFDTSSCRSVFVGHLHHKVSEAFLAQVFGTVGPLVGCKLVKKEKSCYGFVEYLDHRAAVVAISALNGRQLFSKPLKVNWAYTSEVLENKTGHFKIFIGNLGPDITDAALFSFLSTYPSCLDVKVMFDLRTGRSRGFGFASFSNKEDADRAIEESTGKMLGGRAIRCGWASETETISEGQQVGKAASRKGPENDSRYTTVYVGNLSHEVTKDELLKEFYTLGVGVIEDVRIQKDKGFGFVKYSAHEEAAHAIQAVNGRSIYGKTLKCSWGYKRKSHGASSGRVSRPTSGQRVEEVQEKLEYVRVGDTP